MNAAPREGRIVARSKTGLPTTWKGAPGVTGPKPSALKTWKAESEPRSSLPGRPSSVGRKSVRISDSSRCVPHGAPANGYIHGTCMSCSLPGACWSSR